MAMNFSCSCSSSSSTMISFWLLVVATCTTFTCTTAFELRPLRVPVPVPVVSTTSTTTTTTTTLHMVLYDPRSADALESEFVEFPTPSQRVALKKAALKRLARKELISMKLPSSEEDSDSPFSQETVEEIYRLMQQEELVQVRGISKNDKKYVFGTAERLVLELEMMVGAMERENEKEDSDSDSDDENSELLPISLLSTKGHTAVIYSPTLPLEHPLHVMLRTSVGQKNTWRKRTKAPRDHRGQIIKNDDEQE